MKSIMKPRNIISLPERFWNAIDNKIDGELINSRGDALVYLLAELEKVKPECIEVGKMMYIPHSEYEELKRDYKELREDYDNIKILLNKSTPQRKWATEVSLDLIEKTMNLTSDNSVLIAMSIYETNKTSGELLRKARQVNYDLKKRIAELEKNTTIPTLDALIEEGEV
jgi:hypothetical protein